MNVRSKREHIISRRMREQIGFSALGYDWLEQTFQDWSFTFLRSFLFYEDDEEMDEDTRNIYRQGMAAFGGIAPNYHIELWERPTIVWDFHSLLLAIQMMFSFMLADETSSLKLCKNCMKAFFAKDDTEEFCCPKCEAEYDEDGGVTSLRQI